MIFQYTPSRNLVQRIVAIIVLLFVAGVPFASAQLSLQMLIVGGGGGGGRNASDYSSGGGGGSSGNVFSSSTSAMPNSVFTITVGAGGKGYRYSPAVTQTAGEASSVKVGSTTWSANGGNFGGNATSTSSSGAGGASVNTGSFGAGGRGGIYNNGNNASGWPVSGGNGTSAYSSWGAATNTGELSGGTRWYGGGGAGGNWGSQLGSGVASAGLGGGGLSNTDAMANTGGGGGGANSNQTSGYDRPGGNGGSGLVIIMYAGAPKATGGTITQSGGNTYHSFLSSGTLTFNTVLPVVWQSFTAKKVGASVELSWSVVENLTSQRFVVQRSVDGVEFKPIARIAMAVSGDYMHTDADPLTGNVYYRIKQVDMDGQVTFSKTVVVWTSGVAGGVGGFGGAAVSLYPNPVRDRLHVVLPSGAATGEWSCTVRDVAGVLVARRKLAVGSNEIDMSGFSSGLYIVSVWENGVCVKVEKVIK